MFRIAKPLHLTLAVAIASAGACKKDEEQAPPAAKPAATAPTETPAAETMPITTSSTEALEHYRKGQALTDALRGQDARQHFERALAADPSFAVAQLNLAFSETTTQGFFAQLDKAKALGAKASPGEQLWIEGVVAGSQGKPLEQREAYVKLVAMHPKDARAHNLLGNNHFGAQDYEGAIESYEKAIAIDPAFSQPYNQLGYSYRFLNKHDQAEKAFKKYIEVLPNEPNPYDSYAELLLKLGRYDESIANYRKALERDANFVPSRVGIATNLNLKGEHAKAREELAALYKNARTDGEKQAAHFAMAVSYLDEGKPDAAIKELKKNHAISEAKGDVLPMANTMNTIANVLLETGKIDAAAKTFDKAAAMVSESKVGDVQKQNFARGVLFNQARVALARNDLSTARDKAAEFSSRAKTSDNPGVIRASHRLAGEVALAEKNWDTAVTELSQANLQNPYNRYRLAMAYEGKGDQAKAKELRAQALGHNSLNSINYAFLRMKKKR